jgi:hypothetical protein
MLYTELQPRKPKYKIYGIFHHNIYVYQADISHIRILYLSSAHVQLQVKKITFAGNIYLRIF